MKKREVRLTVRMSIPNGASARDCRDYVDDAVGTWAGQFHPDDPRRYMGDDAKVTFYRSPIVGSKGT